MNLPLELPPPWDIYRDLPLHLKYISGNKTLYITKLSDKFSDQPMAVDQLKSVEEVMDHFKPDITVTLFDERDMPVVQTFTFRQMSDFNRDGLIAQSELLRLLDSPQTTSADSQYFLLRNLEIVVRQAREFESTYQGVALFFENALSHDTKVRNALFMNTGIDQLDATDICNKPTIEHIRNSLNTPYARFDLNETYSLLVIPGFLGNKITIDTWAKIAADHKLTLITDYKNLDSLQELVQAFKADDISSDNSASANIVMTCNYLVGRGKYTDLGEAEALFIAPSVALAGKLYANLISQTAAGYEHGTMSGVERVRLDLLKIEVGELAELGLVPMSKEFGRVMANSAKTLYNGDNAGLKHYATVRLFDWIIKNMMQQLNKLSFVNWDADETNATKKQMVQFLDKLKINKIIDDFEVPTLTRDSNQPDRILVGLSIKPLFPAKTFLLNMTGMEDKKGDKTYLN